MSTRRIILTESEREYIVSLIGDDLAALEDAENDSTLPLALTVRAKKLLARLQRPMAGTAKGASNA